LNSATPNVRKRLVSHAPLFVETTVGVLDQAASR
jgi:hypothetical protein